MNVPVATVLTFDGALLPVGYEWPNGQTLASASANYPDYNARKGSGVTVDLRGWGSFGKDDMGGVAAGRITTAILGFDGAALDSVGGLQNAPIAQANLPAISLATTIPAGQGDHAHPANNQGATVLAGGGVPGPSNAGGVTGTATLPAMSGTTALGGSGIALPVMPPTAIMNKILVVE